MDEEFGDVGPMGLAHPTCEQMRHNFRVIRRDIISYIMNNRNIYLRKTTSKCEKGCGKKSKSAEAAIPLYLQKGATAIAAVLTCKSYVVFKKTIQTRYNIAGPTFTKYQQKVRQLENPSLSFGTLLSLEGRPAVYDARVDSIFLGWLSDDDTATIDKTLAGMVTVYREIHCDVNGIEEGENLSDEGIRRHIFSLLEKNGYKMRKPKIVDAKRCIKFDTLKSWYQDDAIMNSLKDIHPRLLFNADETEINRKGYFRGKVASFGKTQPRIAARDRTGSHVSLFIIISAAGSLVEPAFVLHGNPEKYISAPSLFDDKVKCIHTANGYMERETFKMIMKEYFVPYVQEVRKKLGVTDRAALVVDGHLSRYDIETFQLLRDADIDLIILPAHSSHISQPLDLNLNGLIKRAFPVEFRKGVPSSVLKDIEKFRNKKSVKPVRRGRSGENTGIRQPSSKKRRRGASKDQGLAMVNTHDSTVCDEAGGDETVCSEAVGDEADGDEAGGDKAGCASANGDTSKRQKLTNAAMERLCTVYAIQNVLLTLKPRSIASSWAASGLHPFTGVPPITKQLSNSMLREMYACDTLSASIRPRSKNTIIITGLVNSDEGIERFKQLLLQKELKPRRYKGQYRSLTSTENSVNSIDIVNENEDVGDYVTMEPGSDPDASVMYGNSDAQCYVVACKRKHRFSTHFFLRHKFRRYYALNRKAKLW